MCKGTCQMSPESPSNSAANLVLPGEHGIPGCFSSYFQITSSSLLMGNPMRYPKCTFTVSMTDEGDKQTNRWHVPSAHLFLIFFSDGPWWWQWNCLLERWTGVGFTENMASTGVAGWATALVHEPEGDHTGECPHSRSFRGKWPGWEVGLCCNSLESTFECPRNCFLEF